MKIAISVQGKDLGSPLDPRFGRAEGFLVCDTEGGEPVYVPNSQNMSLAQGAGLQAAQTVAGAGAQAVVTGHVGPKAFLALNKGRIAVHLVPQGAAATAAQALELFRAGKLPEAQGADKDGHW
ncbi:NifB/NifX family molybdenum-iron cluster-binding protein [Desulfovibrio aminophilus]|nr:NifB/NifX family molybdenum-iron cluster-binding protein [Desulfovibrio aminophilus]MCM0754570.1 NifB/NifX family molybdenum-iron cluster-binding protein [Desulfovibrio aminophilus]